MTFTRRSLARAYDGTEGLKEALSEGVTSTSLEPLKEATRAAAHVMSDSRGINNQH